MIGIIGLGKLGLAIASIIASCTPPGTVLGMDRDAGLVAALRSGTFHSDEPGVDALLATSNIVATTDLSEVVSSCRILLLYVDTPQSSDGTHYYDHKNVSAVLAAIARIQSPQQQQQHVVICCTVSPGYCRTEGKALLLTQGHLRTLSYNPQFVAQGNIVTSFTQPDLVLIGTDEGREAESALRQFYDTVLVGFPSDRVRVMSYDSAEICKLSLNCFITTKISFANTIGDIADETPTADKLAILSAIGLDSRIGGKCLLPGYGYGGPCFPRDNKALVHHANAVGVHASTLIATDAFNDAHCERMIRNELAKKGPHLFDGVNYKPNCAVVILEESQQLKVALGVARAGRTVVIRDRKAIVEKVREMHGTLFQYVET